jgi:PAS domain S-box-containing protein
MVCAAATKPDLVLLDVHIQGDRDGIETAQQLTREHDVAVAYLAAHADPTTIERASRCAPGGFLVKPFKREDLFSLVEIELVRARVARMERQVRERDQLLVTTLRSIGDAVFATDGNMAVTFMNAAAENLVGWSFAEAAGRPIHDIVQLRDEASGASLSAVMTEAMWGRAPCRVPSATLVTRGGALRLVSDNIAPILDGEDLLGCVVVLVDVTEQRTLARRLELADRMTSLGKHSASIGHDVNNALTVVAGNLLYLGEEVERTFPSSTSMLTEVPSRAFELRQAIADARAGAERIEQIAVRLRLFGGDEARSESVDVGEVLAWALGVTEREWKARARVSLDLHRVPHVEGDEVRVGQIFLELLSRASQAVPPGNLEGHEIRITGSRDAEGWAVVTMSHSGGWSGPAILDRVADSATARAGTTVRSAALAATATRLSICAGIVRELGGEITQSVLGEMDEVRVRLPPAQTIRLRPARRLPPSDDADVRARVLVVDDEELVGQVVVRVLSAEHEVVAVQSGADAVELLRRGAAFDVVICDLVMPEMGGLDLFYWLRTQRPELVPGFMFLTGGAIDRKTSIALDRLVEPRMQKPFEPAELRALVATLVRRRRS